MALIQSHIMRFLWRGRPPKVAKATLVQSTDAGGLKAPEIYSIQRASRVAWISRMMTDNAVPFVRIFEARIQPIKLGDIVKMNYTDLCIERFNISQFYKDLLKWLRELLPI